MSKIKLGLPSKGRIQEDMNNFLASAGIEIKKDGGQRTYVGSFSNFEGFELRFLSANLSLLIFFLLISSNNILNSSSFQNFSNKLFFHKSGMSKTFINS